MGQSEVSPILTMGLRRMRRKNTGVFLFEETSHAFVTDFFKIVNVFRSVEHGKIFLGSGLGFLSRLLGPIEGNKPGKKL